MNFINLKNANVFCSTSLILDTSVYFLGFDDDGVMGGMDVSVYTNSGCNSVDGEASDVSIFYNFADSGEYEWLVFIRNEKFTYRS